MANTPLRNVRVPDEVWEAAKTRAAREGKTVTEIVVSALRRYGSKKETT